MTFTSRIIADSNRPIHYIWGKNENGLDYHWFITGPTAKMQIMLSGTGGRVNLASHGTVLACGLGHKPSAHTKDVLKMKYSVDLDAAALN